MMCIYPIVRIQLSFVKFSLLIVSKTECKSIYYQFRCDHESSSFWKPKIMDLWRNLRFFSAFIVLSCASYRTLTKYFKTGINPILHRWGGVGGFRPPPLVFQRYLNLRDFVSSQTTLQTSFKDVSLFLESFKV